MYRYGRHRNIQSRWKKISEFQLNQVDTQKINLTGSNSGVFLAQFITIDGKIEYTKIIK